VTLAVRGLSTTVVTQKLSQLSPVKRVEVVKSDNSKVVVTIFPKPDQDGELTRAVMDASQVWEVEEMHAEEGRLDDVFRSITMSDTQRDDSPIRK
jgi:ABC-2 type transport system ATP-binding protein